MPENDDTIKPAETLLSESLSKHCSLSWFRTGSAGFSIEEEQVTRHTDVCVWTLRPDFTPSGEGGMVEERCQIKSDWWQYWPTKQEAVYFLTKRAMAQIESAQWSIYEAKRFLSQNTQVMHTEAPFEGLLETYTQTYAFNFQELVEALPEIKFARCDLSDADYDTFLRNVLTNHEEISPIRLHKKKLEMFISYSLLNLHSETLLMDVAGGGFSYAGRVGAKCAYLQDLEIRPSVKRRVGSEVEYLECNAGAIPLPDGSIDAICCHHAYEHFQGTADIDFMHEIQRLLAPGGAAVIVPIFLSKARLEMTNLAGFSNWTIDEKYRVFDPVATLPGTKSGHFARIYDPPWFRERVLSVIDVTRFAVEIFEITRDGHPVPDPAMYVVDKISNFNFPYRALRITRLAGT